MKEQKFDINQKVWILQWNFVDGQDRRTVDMPYKIAERRIVGVHGQADWDENGNTIPIIRYSIAERVGTAPELNDMDGGFSGMQIEFWEHQIHDSYDSAVQAIVQKIDDRIGELEKMKSDYIQIEKEKGGEWEHLIDDMHTMLDKIN